jgi:hypothetical protein
MNGRMYMTTYTKGWPWKRPKPAVVTDSQGGVWTHDETWWEWLRWRWGSQYSRITSTAEHGK